MARVPLGPEYKKLDQSIISAAGRHIERVMRYRIIGQDEAVDAICRASSQIISPIRDSSRPAGTFLFLGPTGVGKTETARSLSMAFFGTDDGVIRINCEEYAHGHEMAKLLGAPPGYVGYQIEPLLSQARIDAAHRQALAEGRGLVAADRRLFSTLAGSTSDAYISIVLFDEIEKAHPMVWNALLGVLDDGTLTLGNNQTVDFTRAIVICTSNVGSRQIAELTEGALGFHSDTDRKMRTKSEIQKTALEAAQKTFPAEWLNRFDEIKVFEQLDLPKLHKIFDKFLNNVRDRLTAGGMPIMLRVDDEARDMILTKCLGDLKYGARPLRRAIERLIVDKISRFIGSNQLLPGAELVVCPPEDPDSESLEFFLKQGEELVLMTNSVGEAAPTAPPPPPLIEGINQDNPDNPWKDILP